MNQNVNKYWTFYESQNNYYRWIRDIPILPIPNVRFLIRKAQEGDVAARDRVIEHHLKWAYKIALGFKFYKGVDVMDLIQEANLALFDTLRNFNLEKETAFTTLATFWIRQRIYRYFHANKGCVRLPCYMEEFKREYQNLEGDFFKELGRAPSKEEVAQALGVPEERLKTMQLSAVFNEVSLDAVVDDSSTALHDLISIVEPYVKDDFVEIAIGLLDGRERKILTDRFVDGMTLEAVARTIGITRVRVRQIEKKAIERLKIRMAHAKKGVIRYEGREV